MGRRYRAFSSPFPTPPSPEVYCLRGEVDHGEMVGSTIRKGKSGNLLNCHLVFSFSRYPFPSLLSCHSRRRALLCRGGEMGGGGGLHFIAEGRMRQCSSTNSLKQCRSALFCLRALSPLPSLDKGRYHTLVRRSCPPDRGRSVSLPRKRRLKRLARNESCTQDCAVERCEQHKRGERIAFLFPHFLSQPPPSLLVNVVVTLHSWLSRWQQLSSLYHTRKKKKWAGRCSKKIVSLSPLFGRPHPSSGKKKEES